MKTRQWMGAALMGVTLFSSAVMADESLNNVDNVKATEDALMMSAYNRALEADRKMSNLRYQLDVVKLKRDIVVLMDECRRKGMECPYEDELDISAYDGPVPGMRSGQAQSGMEPEMLGLDAMGGRQLQPGDEGYEYYPQDNYAIPQQPAFVPVESDPVVGDEDAVIMDGDPYAPIDGELVFDEADFEPVSMTPELLGIENDEAIFRVNGAEVRAKGGQTVKGTEWKVRDVSFDKVWVKGPDGKSQYLPVSWR